MMVATMMGSSMVSTSEETNERISKARPERLRRAEPKRTQALGGKERLNLRRFRGGVREMASDRTRFPASADIFGLRTIR